MPGTVCLACQAAAPANSNAWPRLGGALTVRPLLGLQPKNVGRSAEQSSHAATQHHGPPIVDTRCPDLHEDPEAAVVVGVTGVESGSP